MQLQTSLLHVGIAITRDTRLKRHLTVKGTQKKLEGV